MLQILLHHSEDVDTSIAEVYKMCFRDRRVNEEWSVCKNQCARNNRVGGTFVEGENPDLTMNMLIYIQREWYYDYDDVDEVGENVVLTAWELRLTW